MPPKKVSSMKTISINSTDSKSRSNGMINDLVTKSQAVLSSQASVYMQRTQSSQSTNNNFGFGEFEQMELNREELNQVFITKDEEDVILKILEVARKGKVNSKNAFEIPIKVIHSEQASSANNRFWKFASQLLGASMSIYDKRVENMHITTDAFRSKLSRIGFDVRDRKLDKQNEDRLIDDIHVDEERRAMRQNQERQQLLKIDAENFSGSFNLDDPNVIGFDTLERKEKLDIKVIEHQFIADPTFSRTQQMFDSYSLKSLMLNIFELSNDLDVRIFYKSDLQWQKMRVNTQAQNGGPQVKFPLELGTKTQNQVQNQNSFQHQHLPNIQKKQQQQPQIAVDKQQAFEEQPKAETDTLTNKISNQEFSKAPISYNFQKHLVQSKALLYEKDLFDDIHKFIINQEELSLDYLNRNPNVKKELEQSRDEGDDQINGYVNSNQFENINQTFYEKVVEKQRQDLLQKFKQFDGNFDQNTGALHFQELQNGQGLYEAHETQSQPGVNNDNQYGNSFFTSSAQSPFKQFSERSLPLSYQYQQGFYSFNDKDNFIEPIMPWEIQFKNLKLNRKKKLVVGRGGNQGKQSKQSKRDTSVPIFSFDLQILSRNETINQQNTKKEFMGKKSRNMKYTQKHLSFKQFQGMHSLYSRESLRKQMVNVSRINDKKMLGFSDSQNDVNLGNYENFSTNIDKNISKMKYEGMDNRFNEQTRLFQDNQLDNGFNDFEGGQHQNEMINTYQTKNTSFFGQQMGVSNIREIKNFIKRELEQKNRLSLQFASKLLPNLSPQQLFTIFLHLTNELELNIYHQNDDEISIVIEFSKEHIQMRSQANGDELQI